MTRINVKVNGVRFPGAGGATSVYEKLAQPASGFAIVGVAAHADAGLTDVRSDMYAAEDYRRLLLGIMVRRGVARARP